MNERTQEALDGALSWLATLTSPPGFEARVDGQPSVQCEAPYAVALVATAWRCAGARRPAPPALAGWLEAACDTNGLVRFFGPDAPIIRPDLDDTAIVWAERRALTEAPASPLACLLVGLHKVLGCDRALE